MAVQRTVTAAPTALKKPNTAQVPATSSGNTQPIANWIGAYDVTPDCNSILGPVGDLAGLTVACGCSGHGFKLAQAVR